MFLGTATRAAAAICMVAGLLGIIAQRAQATPDSANVTAVLVGKIAYVKNFSGVNNEIFSISPDGTANTQLTRVAPLSAYAPAWSPDGTQIAFLKAGSQSANGIYLMNADGSNITLIPNTNNLGSGISALSPSWSPNGSKVSFVRNFANGESFGYRISTISPTGTGRVDMTTIAGPIFYTSWSPDGTKIAFEGEESFVEPGQSNIYIANTNGSGAPVRLNKTTAKVYKHPSWSPDGTKILCTHGGDLITIDVATGVETIITTIFDDNPSWSPDGKKIVFTQQVNSQAQLFTMNADGSSRIPTTSNGGNSASWINTPVTTVADIDGSGTGTKYDALTDGLLFLRYTFGITGVSLTANALGATATRTDPAAIGAYILSLASSFDVDGDGKVDALTDGLLVLRYLFGLRGSTLIAQAVSPGATRTTAPQIEAYLQSLMP